MIVYITLVYLLNTFIYSLLIQALFVSSCLTAVYTFKLLRHRRNSFHSFKYKVNTVTKKDKLN